MKRTAPLALVVAAVLGGGAGFVLDMVLTSAGRATFTPQLVLPMLLVVLAVVVLAMAIPVRRAVHGSSARRVDPFHALRTAVLAKASSIVGAIVGGGSLGLLVFVLTRPVTPAVGSMATTIATAVAAAILVVAALVAEMFCIVPKDPDERHPDDPGAGAPAAD